MNEGPDIQHKPKFEGDSVFAFENGERVPITAPQFSTDESPASVRPTGLTVEQFANVLLIGNAIPAKIGERVLLLAYASKLSPFAPKNLRELGDRLGCSHVAAGDRLNKLQVEIARELPNF